MHFPLRVTPDTTPRRSQHGQVVVIFAGAMLLFVLLAATVIDLSWYWTNNLRMQRAADAAALAGVVFLPNELSRAVSTARDEAEKNGYEHGVDGVVVTAVQDVDNDRRLLVTITGNVDTYFARAVGIQSWPARRTAKADYVLPVPMGSPQNYYGVGFLRDAEDTTTFIPGTPIIADNNTNYQVPSGTAPTGGQWSFTPTGAPRTITSIVTSDNNEYATENTTGQAQQWANFNLTFPTPGVDQSLSIRGIEVRLTDAFLNGACAGSQIRTSISWNAGGAFSTVINTPNLGTNVTTGDYILPATGGDTSFAAWGTHAWVSGDFTNANFRVRLEWLKGCTTAGRLVNLDQLWVRVSYRMTTQTWTPVTNTAMADVPMISPYGDTLAPQNFWAAMQSQGAPNIQGDAYMTKYDNRTGPVLNNADGTDPDAKYAWDKYYSYAIEMPPNSAGGEVWIFDPGFCDATSAGGTGENWSTNPPTGNSSRQPVSAFYTLEDAGTNLFDSGDDGTAYSVSSGTTFRRLSYQDDAIITELGATDTGAADCGNLAWHYDVNNWNSGAPSTPRRGWYLLGSGLTGGSNGTVYRLHSYSTDPSNLTDQDNTTALNAFAIYAKSGTGVPKVYGMGAMEAYIRLPGGQQSEFYLAQIEDVHAGKTMIVNLWDPGDTGNLSATLEILAPGALDYTPVTFKHSAIQGTSGASSCTGFANAAATSVVTNTGGSSRYNGCWLTMEIAIPSDYTAPHPSTDTVTADGGWWKIRYGMGGLATDFSTDLTTWQVDIRGNPVHLVLP